MRPTRFLLLAAFAPSLACSSKQDALTTPLAYCSAPRSIAVEVVVTDSVTGASIGDAARGIAQTGNTSDSLQYFTPPPALYGGSALGTFTVIIEHAGYAQWRRDNIVVSQQGPCGNTIPVQLSAKMKPLP